MAKKKSVLQKVLDTPDDKIRDDDHLERPGLTKEEALQGFGELYDKFKDAKAKTPKSDAFGQGIIDALNSDKSIY